MVFICYNKCSTCKKAQAFLDSHGLSYESRPIKEQNPTAQELEQWHKPVSYTHLDVYKRQLYDCSEPSFSPPEPPGALGSSVMDSPPPEQAAKEKHMTSARNNARYRFIK